MSDYVWCKAEECRIPSFRCFLCRDDCHALRKTEDEADRALDLLRKSGKFREHYVMKRKESPDLKNQLSFLENEASNPETALEAPEENGGAIFLFEDGKLKPFSAKDYTASTLYQVVESYSVECRLVRPDDSSGLVFEGKKPSKKTLPILIKKTGECVLLDSWEELESQPVRLAEARDVFGAMPVRQVFVLKRK